MKRSTLAACGVVALLLTGLPGAAGAAGWLVLGNTAWVSGDPTIVITNESVFQPSVSVKVTQAGDLKWIATNIPFSFPQPNGNTIDLVAVCYKTTNSQTFISQTRLTEYLGPSVAFVKHDDPTDHNSTTDDCYVSTVANYTPAGSVNLALRLFFGSTADTITLGLLAVHFK